MFPEKKKTINQEIKTQGICNKTLFTLHVLSIDILKLFFEEYKRRRQRCLHIFQQNHI